MRNYWDSDYAVNKDRAGIVYQFADGEKELTLADYLLANPDNTEADFAELKALSDGIYYEQALEDTQYGKRKQALGLLENAEEFATPSPDIQLIHKNEKGQALKATRRLLDSGELTEVQRRRFLLHFFKGLSTRQIAKLESVSNVAVFKSLCYAEVKLKKYFSEQGQHPPCFWTLGERHFCVLPFTCSLSSEYQQYG